MKNYSQGQKIICFSREGGKDAFHGHIVPFFNFYTSCLPYSLGGIHNEVNAVQQLLGSSERR